MFSNKENVNILTALLIKHGVRHVVVCPGSRNAPLIHNFNECGQLICHPVTDERSAGFIALGMRQHLCEPVAVCVTSGSALLNLMPAAAEATYRHNGIIIISADRPEAWIGQLDGQTIPQKGALGGFAPFSVSLPEPHDFVERWQCNRSVNEALMENAKPEHPTVHINIPVSEPLFEFTVKSLPDERVIKRFDWNSSAAKNLIKERLSSSSKPMLVFGQMNPDVVSHGLFAALSDKFVLLAEPISVSARSYTDQMIYALKGVPDSYRPDLVIYLGGNTVSKRLRHFLRVSCGEAFHICVNEDGELNDISCNTSAVIQSDLKRFIQDLNSLAKSGAQYEPYRQLWNELSTKIADRHSSFNPVYSGMLAVKMFEKQVKADAIVHYSNSMSVRLASVYAKHYRWCNRGINGIEGSLSTAAGVALVARPSSNVYCVTGDLSFFYDQNALWPADLKGNFRILLLNNGQGGIFKSLPNLDSSPAADTMISGAHHLSAKGVCEQFGLTYLVARNDKELKQKIRELCSADSYRPVLLEVFTNAAEDQKAYSNYLTHISYGLEEDI